MALPEKNLRRPAVPVFIAATVMLTFISYWRVSAVVLSDLGASAYYAGGNAEHVVGKSAPWFILAVMLFSYAVRAIYIESSSMYVRGPRYAGLHHYDVVALALKELKRDLRSVEKERLKDELRKELERRAGRRFLPSM